MQGDLHGFITIHPGGSVTIKLENGSYGHKLHPNGIKRFLEVEIEMLEEELESESESAGN